MRACACSSSRSSSRGPPTPSATGCVDFLTSHDVLLSTDSTTYRSLALPTLIIWGDRDTTTPLPPGQRLAQVIAGADLAVMPGIGHMPQLEDVDQFNRLLLTFLERQRGARP